MKGFSTRGSRSERAEAFEALPEGLRAFLVRRAFEIFLRRLITLAFWVKEGYRGSSSLNKPRLIRVILEAASLPPDRACRLLNEAVERSEKKKRLVKALLVLGVKGYLFWNRHYGLTLVEEPRPSEAY